MDVTRIFDILEYKSLNHPNHPVFTAKEDGKWVKHYLKEYTKNADIVIVAAGCPNTIDESYIKDGATVIDVGINRDENGKLCGDVDYASVEPRASYITPVPGGVGAVTTALLAAHVVRAAIRSADADAHFVPETHGSSPPSRGLLFSLPLAISKKLLLFEPPKQKKFEKLFSLLTTFGKKPPVLNERILKIQRKKPEKLLI